jgi:hypothetical protein
MAQRQQLPLWFASAQLDFGPHDGARRPRPNQLHPRPPLAPFPAQKTRQAVYRCFVVAGRFPLHHVPQQVDHRRLAMAQIVVQTSDGESQAHLEAAS